MTALVRPFYRVSLVATVLTAVGMVAVGHASPFTSGPSITLSATTVRVGQEVLMTIDGFKTQAVNVSVCGNEARRGSPDCNLTASEGIRLELDGSTLAQMPVAAPPVACPCVLRASSRTNDEVAIAPITLLDFDAGSAVDGPSPISPLLVSVTARSVSANFFDGARAALGGPVGYEVTVTVKNQSTVPVRGVLASGSFGRNAQDYLGTIDVADPGEIGAGQTWQQMLTVRVPAPSLGEVEWRVAVSGGGPTINAVDTTSHRPWLLVLVVLFLVADGFFVLIRWRIRRRAAQAAEALLVQSEAGESTPQELQPDGDLVTSVG